MGRRRRLLVQVSRNPELTAYVVGNDELGLLYGVGYLLRQLHMSDGCVLVPADLKMRTAPYTDFAAISLGYP